MKCSKCGYLGFESSDRCRNCGYEFSLSPDYGLPDLAIRTKDEGHGGLDDFALVDRAMSSRASAGLPLIRSESRPARVTPSAMPLFAPGMDDDTPLITKASPPRAPLSVRKSTPEVARLRSLVAPKSGSLDLDLDGLASPPMSRPDGPERLRVEPSPSAAYEDAGVGRRVLAACVDSAILLAIDLLVLYFTMQICGVGAAELWILPKTPLLVFLVVQNVGYLIAFTAGGQTLGKMAAGIKVVSDGDDTLDIGSALKRTAMWLVLAVPAGLGLLSMLFDHDHRGLHDRFAGTRVVRATA